MCDLSSEHDSWRSRAQINQSYAVAVAVAVEGDQGGVALPPTFRGPLRHKHPSG